MDTETTSSFNHVREEFQDLLEHLMASDPSVLEVASPREEPSPRPHFYVHRDDGLQHDAVLMTGGTQFERALEQLALGGPSYDGCRKVLACPDFVPPERMAAVPADVTVWGPDWFFKNYWQQIACPSYRLIPLSAVSRIHRGVGIALRRRLNDHGTGKIEGRDREYEVLIRDIIQYLFFPDLDFARHNFTNATRNRRVDVLFQNNSVDPQRWGRFRSAQYLGEFVVVECKNTASGIGQNDVDQLAAYLDGAGFSRVGVLVGRRRQLSSLQNGLLDARRKSPRPIILVLDDKTIGGLVDARYSRALHFEIRVEDWILAALG